MVVLANFLLLCLVTSICYSFSWTIATVCLNLNDMMNFGYYSILACVFVIGILSFSFLLELVPFSPGVAFVAVWIHFHFLTNGFSFTLDIDILEEVH